MDCQTSEKSPELASPPWRGQTRKVYVVLPAYNEEEAIQPLLQRIDQAMHAASQEYRVILVDDGSSDDTVRLATEYQRFIPIEIYRHEVNQGLGNTIRDGLRIAAEHCRERDIVVAMDADNTHTPGLIMRMVRQVREGSDVVIASRYQRGACIKGVPFHRELLSIGASYLFRLSFPMKGVRDYTCSFRAYRGLILKEAFAHYGDEFINRSGFESMVDILLKLRPLNLVFSEVPMVLRYDLKGNLSKMQVGQTVLNTLGLIIRRKFGG